MGFHRPRSNGYVICARDFLNSFNSNNGIGYNMARNLQAKLPSSDTLRVYDVNTESVARFVNDTKALSTGAKVQTAANVREAAEDSVSLEQYLIFPHPLK